MVHLWPEQHWLTFVYLIWKMLLSKMTNPHILLPRQVIRYEMQRLPGEDRAHRVCDARPGERLPPGLLLLLRVRAPAVQRRRVCAEGRPAAVQERLREGEGAAQLRQPRKLRFG